MRKLLSEFLEKRSGYLIFLVIFTILNFLYLMRGEEYKASTVEWNAYSAVFIAMFTLWFIRSWLKYGIADTAIFCIFLPFYMLGEIIYRTSPKNSNFVNNSNDYNTIMSLASIALEKSVNDIYAGKVKSMKVDDDSLIITFETPYGIRPEWPPFIRKLAHEIGIKARYISTYALSDRITQFRISTDGLKRHRNRGIGSSPWLTSTDVTNRILLKYPTKRFNRK